MIMLSFSGGMELQIDGAFGFNFGVWGSNSSEMYGIYI